MALFLINGHEVPYPKRGFQPTVATIVDNARNANGTIVAQRIGRDQYKLNQLEWSWLSAEDWSFLLSLVSDFFVLVTFTDPVTNTTKTVRMYVGNRTAEPYWLDDNGKPTYYRNCKFNLIDTGE